MPASLPSLNAPVADHVHQKFARVNAGQTVAEALEARRHPQEGRIIYFYTARGKK